MEPLFIVDSRHHGKGPVIFAWHPAGSFVASTGTSRVVHIFDSHGKLVNQIVPPSASICTALEWDSTGEVLAIIQANSSNVVFHCVKKQESTQFDAGVKDITVTKWSSAGKKLALGTSKGLVVLYDHDTGVRNWAEGRHKRRIVCGAWSPSGQRFCFASEDRQITICTATGETIEQVKVKSRPVDILYEGHKTGTETNISVNLDARTLLLYDIDEKDGALELVFQQQRYGALVKFLWCGEFGEKLMVAFSSGHVVVVFTDPDQIGQENRCIQMHPTELIDLAFCPDTLKVASCGDSTVKLIDEQAWKEIKSYYLEKDLEKVAFARQGQILSVSSKNGCLYTFILQPGQEESRVLYPHSLMVRAMRPLSTYDIIVISGIIAISLLMVASTILNATYKDVWTAVFGMTVSI